MISPSHCPVVNAFPEENHLAYSISSHKLSPTFIFINMYMAEKFYIKRILYMFRIRNYFKIKFLS
jgi:hypothetical protein